LSPGPSQPLVAFVGQTATGKSDLAIELARQVDGEIVNADAMALYRGMDIGTAKVPPHQRQGVPHHLFDVLNVSQEASVAIYQQQARAAIDDIRNRNKTAILVGGSGLYVRAALDEIDFPPTDPHLRASLYERIEVEGLEALYRELEKRDPAAAATIQPRNDRRIVRALEVITLTGKPFAASLPTPKYVYPTVQIALTLDQTELDTRIRHRVDQMWSKGLVAETRSLLADGLATGPTAARAVGYAETMRHLGGELSAEETRALIAQNTRQLARRQRRWFARDDRVIYLPASSTVAEVRAAIATA